MESKSESCAAFLTDLISSLINSPTTGKTKASFHAFGDAITSKSLHVFGKYPNEMPLMDFDRNTSTSRLIEIIV